jgi:hypothetical protein
MGLFKRTPWRYYRTWRRLASLGVGAGEQVPGPPPPTHNHNNCSRLPQQHVAAAKVLPDEVELAVSNPSLLGGAHAHVWSLHSNVNMIAPLHQSTPYKRTRHPCCAVPTMSKMA